MKTIYVLHAIPLAFALLAMPTLSMAKTFYESRSNTARIAASTEDKAEGTGQSTSGATTGTAKRWGTPVTPVTGQPTGTSVTGSTPVKATTGNAPAATKVPGAIVIPK